MAQWAALPFAHLHLHQYVQRLDQSITVTVGITGQKYMELERLMNTDMNDTQEQARKRTRDDTPSGTVKPKWKKMTTIPKIQRGEINYTKAIIKGEKDKDENVQDYDEMLEYYAEKAAFLKHPKICDYVEVNFKGDITINNLRPGNYNEIIMIPYKTSLQDNTEHLKTQRSYSTKKAMYSPIRLSGRTTTDRLSYSIYLNIYTKQNHSSKIFRPCNTSRKDTSQRESLC